jgi:large subunit ribosomal protein L25
MDKMENVVLRAERRSVTGKKVGALRRQGKLPCVIYGHNTEPTPIFLDQREAQRALVGLSPSSLVIIELDGKQHSTLVRQKQRNFIRGDLLHIDFQAVSLTTNIKSKVAITYQGIAPAVEEFNGVVVTGPSELNVEGLPQELPDRITIDISSLSQIGDAIYVRDVKVSDNVTILDDPDEILVNITAMKEEMVVEEAPALEEGEPEVIEKGKREDEAEEEEQTASDEE